MALSKREVGGLRELACCNACVDRFDTRRRVDRLFVLVVFETRDAGTRFNCRVDVYTTCSLQPDHKLAGKSGLLSLQRRCAVVVFCRRKLHSQQLCV